MDSERPPRGLEITDSLVRQVLGTPKWIDPRARWSALVARQSAVRALTVAVDSDQLWPLQLRCTWNTMVPNKYEYALHLNNERINALDVGKEHRPFTTHHENYWKDGKCKAARMPTFLTDYRNGELAFREYLKYLNIAYKGPFPWSSTQQTFEGRLILDELFGDSEAD